MSSKLKRFLSLMLVFVMVFSIVPTNAETATTLTDVTVVDESDSTGLDAQSKETSETGDDTGSDETVSDSTPITVIATVNGKEYDSLQKAFDACVEGSTITLQKNVSEVVKTNWPADHATITVTLDLNGKTWDCGYGTRINAMNLTIKNGIIGTKRSEALANNESVDVFYFGGHATLPSTLTLNGVSYFYAELRVNNMAPSDEELGLLATARSNGTPANTTTVIIENGQFDVVTVQKAAYLTINGGWFSGIHAEEGANVVDNRNTSSDTEDSEASTEVVVPKPVYVNAPEEYERVYTGVTVTFIENTPFAADAEMQFTVGASSQTFTVQRLDGEKWTTVEPASGTSTVYHTFDAPGAVTFRLDWDNNGTYDRLVVLMKPVAKVGETYYATIDEAVAAWTDGTTLTLLADATVNLGSAVATLADDEVILDGTNVTAEDGKSAISIESGNVTLVVNADTTLTGGKGGAGVYVAEGASVTIKGTGKLTAIGNSGVDTSDSGAAGIGGTYANGNSGAITIDGATVVAYGYGEHGSGIGSGSGEVVGEIKIINGANVTAYGGYYANGDGTKLQTSYGKSDPEGGAAIGGGGTVADITIDNSTVVAYGGSKAAGIGANFWSDCGTITISGNSNVTAQGGSSSAGIGTSRVDKTYGGGKATIIISGGTVNATGGAYGAGIGGGYNADSLGNGAETSALPEISVTISGGTVTANGGEGGAGIGGGYKTDNVDIDITGGTVTAEAGELVSGKTIENGGEACAIGSGANGSGVFENSPAVEIAATATVTATTVYGGKAAIEGDTDENWDALENVTVIVEDKPVAQVGETLYTTLAEAVAAANAIEGGATVTLLADATVDAVIEVTGNVTIEGAFTVTRAEDYTGMFFTVNSGATLTLDGDLTIDGGNAWVYTNGTPDLDMENGDGTNVTDHITPAEGGVNATAYMIENFGTLNVNDVTIQNNYSTNEAGVIKARSNSTTNIDGATIKHIASNNCGAVVQIGRNNVTSNFATLNIKNGTKITDNFGAYNGGIIIMHSHGNTFNFEGGSIDHNYVGGSGTVIMSYGHWDNPEAKNTVNMSGGTITQNIMEGYGPMYIHTRTIWNMSGGEISYNTSYYPTYVRGNNSGSITGGNIVNNTLTSTYAYTNLAIASASAPNLPITGGTFSQDVTKWCAEGYEAVDNKDGTWTVEEIVYATVEVEAIPGTWLTTEITLSNWADLQAALGEKTNLPVKVVFKHDKQISEALVIAGTTTKTIDLNGKTLTATENVYPVIRVQGGADVTVKNGSIVNATDYVFVLGASDGSSAGNLTIESGSYTGQTTVASVTKGTLTIKGGEFKAAEGEYGSAFLLNCVDANYKDGSAKISVTGGTFTGFDPMNNASEGVETDFVADGYISETKDEGATYTVREANYVAQVGETKYESLAEAVAAANAAVDAEGNPVAATVELLADVTLGEKLTISGDVTISGEYTITRDDAYTGTLFAVNSGAALTLDDGLTIDGGNNYAFDSETYAADLAAMGQILKADSAKWFTPEEGAPVATAFMITTTGGTVNLNKVTVQNNYSVTSGVVQVGAGSTVNLTGAKITHVASTQGNGVAVQASGAGIAVNMNEGTVIDGNHVGGNHGIFKIYSGTVFTMNGGEVKNTTGWNSNGTVVGLYGGTFIMNGGTICSNSAIYGDSNGRNAAIYLHANSVMEMNGGTICHNTGRSRGGIDSSKSTSSLTITGGNVLDNVSIAGNSTADVGGTVGTWSITGGIYSQDVSKWVAPGYACVLIEEGEYAGYYTITKHIYDLYFRDPTTGEQVPGVGPLQGNDLATIIATGKLFYADYYDMELVVLHSTKVDEGAVIDYPMVVNLNGKTLTATEGVYPVIRVQGGANVTVKNGSIVNATDYVFVLGASDGSSAGNLTIESGTYTGQTTVASVTKGTLTIKGGEFKAAEGEYGSAFLLNCVDANYKDGSAKISVTGGTYYGFDPESNAAEGAETNFCAEGYLSEEIEENVWLVREANYVAQITVDDVTTKYESITEAAEAAEAGDTIVVIADHAVEESAVISKDVTLDLGGFTVSAAETLSSKPVIRVLADVTVTNGTIDGTTGINSYAFIVGNNDTAGNLTIADGTYIGVTSAISVTNGIANISGGTFKTGHDGEGTDYGAQYLLNCMDAAYKAGTAKYNITGGTYYGFDPMNNAAEGADTDFVAPGYESVDNGDGTYTVKAWDLYIWNADDLHIFQKMVNAGNNFSGKTVYLMADIDLEGETWTPMSSFAGEFDGNGDADYENYTEATHTISNFHIDATTSSGGFFKTISSGEGERVHDLVLSDVTATVGAYRFGTLANSVQGIVNRVTVKNVTVTTTHTSAWVGGMCAFMSWPWMNDCTVENLVVNAENGADLIGGFACILQKNSNMVFDNNDVNGFKVTVTDTDSSGCGVAGFVTQTQRGWEYPKIINSSVTGIDVTATGLVDVGGFIAWPGAHTTVENCSTSGTINVTGVTSDGCFAGGFFGNLGWNADLGQMGHVVNNCSASVNITTKVAPAGGFVGSATNSNNSSMYATFTNCSASGNITAIAGGAANVGGFAGEADRGVYTNCSATGTATTSGTGYAGGFIGEILDTTPKYDGRYPAGTRDYLVDVITLDNCKAAQEPFVTYVTDAKMAEIVNKNSFIVKLGDSLYATFDAALAAAKEDGKDEAIVLLDTAVLSESKEYDLANETVKTVEDLNPAFRITNGANVIFKNGTVDTAGYCFILGASDGSSAGNLTIESGTYHGSTTVASVTKGTLTVTGGEFSVEPYNGSYEFLLNCVDANYKDGSAKISVTGGTFTGFDPENNAAEGANTNFVAKGYKSETNDEGATYTVVPNKIFEMHLTDANGEAHWLSPMRGNDPNSIIEDSKIWYDSLQGTYSFTLKVLDNYEVDETVLATFPMTIDLGGFTLSASKSLTNAPVIRVLSDVTVTNGTIDGTTGINSYAFIVGNSDTTGNLTIADGTYIGVTSAISVTNGIANISGGTFKTGHDGEGTDYGAQYLLNCMDAAYKAGTAKYNITGGTYYGFNPEVNAAEGANTNYLTEKYTGVETETDVYVVQDYVQWVKDQLLAGNSVTLDRDVTITDYSYVTALKLPSNGNGKYTEVHGNGAVFHVIKPDVVFDLNGHNLTWDAHDEDYCNKRQVSLFMVTITGNAGETSKLTVVDSKGNGSVTVNGMGSGMYVVGVNAAADITGGTWTNNPCNTCEASNIFMYPSHGGTMYISGGNFIQKDSEYLLGWKGSTKETTNNGVGTDYDETKLSITGGIFVGLNPEETKFFDVANSGQETINGVAEGYIAIPYENEENAWEVVKGVWVAQVGETKYTTFEEALEVAQNGEDKTIILLKSIVITEDKTYNLTGVTVNTVEDVNPAFRITNGANVTFKNGTVDTAGYCFILGASDGSSDGNLTIESGTYTGSTSVASVTKGTLTITGGTFTAKDDGYGTGYLLNCIDANYKDESAKIEVKGGTFTGFDPANNAAEGTGTNFVPAGYVSVANADETAWTVKKQITVTVTFDDQTMVFGNEQPEYTYTTNFDEVSEDGTMLVVEIPEIEVTGAGEYEITSNAYVFMNDDYVVEVTAGKLTVVEAVASITVDETTTYYATVQDAVDAANAGDTVTVLVDVTEDVTIGADDEIVLAAGENKLTGAITVEGNLTIASGTFYRGDLGNAITVKGELTIESGTITTYNGNAIHVPNGEDATITISGGTIIGEQGGFGVRCEGSVELSISGGEIWGASGAVKTESKEGSVVISGGSLKADREQALYVVTEDVEVTGGVFTGGKYNTRLYDVVKSENATKFISGGTFNVEPNADYVAEGYVAVQNDDTTWTVEEDGLFEISFARMTLANSLSMSFAFEAGHMEDWTGTYVEIVKEYADGTTQTQTVNYADWSKTTINSIRHYYVTFYGMAAKEMADEITVTVYNAEGEAISKVWYDSVRDYAMRTLAESTNSEERTMVVDMLNYGAAAQEYFDYNADDLANNQLSEEEKAIATPTFTAEDTRVKGTNYLGSNLNLVSSIQLMMAFKNVDQSMHAVITYTDHYGKAQSITVEGSEFELNNGAYVVYIDTLVVADGHQDVTCTVYNGEEVVAQCTDSMESYVARGLVDSKTNDDHLYEMIMKFSDSAYAYLH